MNALDYFLKANLYGLLFAGCYVLLLRRHTFFGLNRAYLLASAVLSLLLPLASLLIQTPEALPIPTGVITLPVAISTAETGPDWALWGAWGYGIITLAGLLFLLVRVFTLLRIIRRSVSFDQGDHTLVLPINPSTPTFSFFRYVVLNPTDRGNSLILQHELVHVRQWHSADVLAMQVVRIVFWACLPLWLLERALRQTHEFLADQQASAHERNYTRLLVDYSFGLRPASLANGFFNPSLLKQRIQMLQQRATSRWALGKYVLIAPLTLSLLAMTTAREEITELVTDQTIDKPITVSGRVTSAVDGKALPGATVLVKNQTKGALTNANGEYKITASPTAALIFRFVGFETQVVNVSDKRIFKTGNNVYMDVLMTAEHTGAVSTGNKRATAESKKAALPESAETQAINKLAIADPINPRQTHLHTPTAYDNSKNARFGLYNDVNPWMDSLRKANVSVKVPSNVNPLYIIDGVEQTDQGLDALNPDDIESIDVLKGDYSATYGIRGKSGVIRITTKKK